MGLPGRGAIPRPKTFNAWAALCGPQKESPPKWRAVFSGLWLMQLLDVNIGVHQAYAANTEAVIRCVCVGGSASLAFLNCPHGAPLQVLQVSLHLFIVGVSDVRVLFHERLEGLLVMHFQVHIHSKLHFCSPLFHGSKLPSPM